VERTPIEEAIAAAADEAHAQWSDLSDDGFEAELRRVAAAQDDPDAYLEALNAGDLYLAWTCTRGDPRAIAAFEAHYLTQVPGLVAHLSLSAREVEDVQQHLRDRLLVGDGAPGKIAGYSGRGSLLAWLRVAAVRTALNLRRDVKARVEREQHSSPEPIPAIEPELLLLRRRFGDAFQVAFRDAFARLGPSERTVLRLQYLDGLPLEAVGRVLGTSRATTVRRIRAARTRLAEDTLRLLSERLRLEPEGLRSLVGVLRSQLEVSLTQLFATAP
jgi:RNA polymerase sigma-70 factor (ECF subfamily)